MVDNRLMFSAPPSTVVLHLGTNNIGQMDACSCRAAVKTALGTLRVRMPQALILWSSILPRIVYHGKRPTGSTSQEALEGVRVSLNNYARRQANRMGNASVIIHDIDRSNHNMFIRDGVHLSDQGSDILILAIANAKEIPGYYDPARFQVHCGIGRWQHCFRFGSRACGKCAFPAARRHGYYSASVCSREWLPQIVQGTSTTFFSLIIALTSFPSFQFTFNCD